VRSAADDVRTAIHAAGGAIPFDRYMRLALYGEHGFYRSGGTAGRRGDFITSVEVGPLFAVVVAAFLDAEWERLGRPDPFTFVDAGAGPGTLARGVVAAAPACLDVLRYVAVEVAAEQRARHPAGVESVGQLPSEPFAGVVLANELLDNLPFRLAVFDDGWREAYVVEQPDATFGEILSAPFDPLPSVLPPRPPHGARAPIQADAAAWITSARALLTVGSVVVIDYMSTTTAGLAVRPYRDWLRTFRRHGRGDHYLVEPGSQDVTAEVALDQLPTPDAVCTQAEWLQRWGIAELVEEGRRVWSERATAPDLAAVRMRSRVGEAEALLDGDGLGAFTVAEWQVPQP
jgi:SAM-dependent MidA family methyltransferase